MALGAFTQGIDLAAYQLNDCAEREVTVRD